METSPQNIIRNFSNARVLVVGDAILDVYWRGNAARLCREAPVQVVEVADQTRVPGGAANSAVNCAQMGADVALVSVAGNDPDGDTLVQLLSENKVKT